MVKMLDFVKEFSKFEFVRIGDDLFLDLVDDRGNKSFHGRIGAMKLKTSINADMTGATDLDLSDPANLKMVGSSTNKTSSEAWNIKFEYNSTTHYMKFSDINSGFSTMTDGSYSQNTYYIETVEGDIRVIKGTAENTFKIVPADPNMKFIDPVVIRTEEKDTGTPKFNFSNDLLGLDIDPFLEDSFIVDTINGKDYDHLIIGDKDGKDRLVIFKEDNIITQDYHEKVIVFQYYNMDSPDSIYDLKLKTIDDFAKLSIERYDNNLNMKQLIINMSKSTLDESTGTCVISVVFNGDGTIADVSKNIDNAGDTSFDGVAWSVLGYMYYINKIDNVSENNEILIPSETVPLTINLGSLVFGYPIRKLIASFGDNNLEIIRNVLGGSDPDFTINGIPFKLPYSETEDALSNGADDRVYYCAGSILMNTKYGLEDAAEDLKTTYHIDKIRSVSDTVQYMFYFGEQSEAILGQIQYDILNFREKSKPYALPGIYQFNDYAFNIVSLDIPGKSNMPIGNNNGFVFKDKTVGTSGKTITDDFGFVLINYTSDAQAAGANDSKPIYKTVIAATKIACASSESFGVLYILEDGYLYWTLDERNSVQIAKVYNKDMILHYGWHKTIECGQVLMTYNDAYIGAFDLSAITDNTVKAILNKFEQYSMVIDQGNKAVLINELITRDFQRDSLKMLIADINNMVISPAGVFSEVSIASDGGFHISCELKKYGDNAYTNTRMLTCVNTSNEYKPFSVSGMFQNSNLSRPDNNSIILVVCYSASSASNMLKGSTIRCNRLDTDFRCEAADGSYPDTVRMPIDASGFNDGASISIDRYDIQFNNYSEFDLSRFYANSTIENNNNIELFLYINYNPHIGTYYPIVKMSSFLENAILKKTNDGKLALNFDDMTDGNKYRIGDCDNMFTNLRNDSNELILERYGGSIKFQAATTDFNPRDIFGLVRPKNIKWLIKTLDENGNVIGLHSH